MLDLVVDHQGSLLVDPTTRVSREIAATLKSEFSPAVAVPKLHRADHDAPSRIGNCCGCHSPSANTKICNGPLGGQINPRTSRTFGTVSSASGARISIVRLAGRNSLRAEGAIINDIDGVRVQTADGWWLLRASNTQAILVARCEAGNAVGLDRLKAAVNRVLKDVGRTAPVW
jgi:hypothetical protein